MAVSENEPDCRSEPLNAATTGPTQSVNVKAKLANFVQWFIRSSESGADADREEALRWTCAALARLLGNLLEGSEGWSRWYWVDDIIPTSETIGTQNELHVEGLAIWGESGGTAEWVEPLSAWVQVREGGEDVGYEMKFGDAETGLGQIPYGKHRSHVKPGCPDEWMFVFTAESSGRART